MGQNDALAIAWGALFRNGAGAYTKCIELASSTTSPDEIDGIDEPFWGFGVLGP